METPRVVYIASLVHNRQQIAHVCLLATYEELRSRKNIARDWFEFGEAGISLCAIFDEFHR